MEQAQHQTESACSYHRVVLIKRWDKVTGTKKMQLEIMNLHFEMQLKTQNLPFLNTEI